MLFSKRLKATVSAFLLLILALSVQANKAEAADISTTSTTPNCIIQLTNTPLSNTTTQGGQITYSFLLKNIGSVPCEDTSTSVYYSADENFVSTSQTPSAHTNYYWRSGTLAPGASYVWNVTTQDASDNNHKISNEACASAKKAANSCVFAATKIASATVSSPNPISSGPIPPAPTPVPAPTPTSPNPPTNTADPTPPNPSPIASTTPVTTPSPVPAKEYGVWFWDSPYALPWTQNKQLIDEAKANGFNTIYITIDDYLNIASLPDGNTKSDDLNTYDADVDQFITYANQNGIAVDAESGSRDWAEAPNTNNAYEIMEYAAQYNSTHAAKFRYVQYDIEPYLLPEYITDPSAVLTDYVALVNRLVSNDTFGLGIEMVVPYFYGPSMGWTPTITYAGQTGSTFDLVLDALDKLPNDSLFMMAYRNSAKGTNGTLAVASDEMQVMNAGKHSTRMIIAQETGDVTPNYVTFYGTSKAYLQSQINIIDANYDADPAFQGIAVDYIDPFLALN